MAHITLKKAMATPCKDCGVLPVLGDDFLYNGGLWLIRCPSCGAESLTGCRRHYAANTWYEMNKGAKNTEQVNQPDSGE